MARIAPEVHQTARSTLVPGSPPRTVPAGQPRFSAHSGSTTSASATRHAASPCRFAQEMSPTLNQAPAMLFYQPFGQQRIPNRPRKWDVHQPAFVHVPNFGISQPEFPASISMCVHRNPRPSCHYLLQLLHYLHQRDSSTIWMRRQPRQIHGASTPVHAKRPIAHACRYYAVRTRTPGIDLAAI